MVVLAVIMTYAAVVALIAIIVVGSGWLVVADDVDLRSPLT